ncbi:MAG: kelch repeat-containing protein, partial [Candidatus Eisenbacteria bacterium]
MNRVFPTGSLAASTAASADDGTWKAFPPPSEREGATTVYDPVRRRMILFGGEAYPISDNDVWVLSLEGDHEWSRLTTQGPAPDVRIDHSAIFDPIRDRMLVYGGVTYGDTAGGVWSLSFATAVPTWSLLGTSGPTPAARYAHSAIYDPRRDRMIVCGGASFGNYSYGETWALSLAEPPVWSPIVPVDSLPFGRVAHQAVYDPVRDRMLILMGGDTELIFGPDDVWALSLADTPTWSLVPTAGPPAPPAWYSAAVYDSTADRVVVWGGATSTSVPNEAWSLELSGTPHWAPLPTPGVSPSYRYRHSGAFDPVARELVIFGGRDEFGTDLGLNDSWALSLGTAPAWRALPTGVSRPSRRLGASAVHDPLRHRMILFGGSDQHFAYCDDVWELSLYGTPKWTPIVPTGSPPQPRGFHTAIYDPLRDRMLVFGGAGDQIFLNDLWALWMSPVPRWEQLTPLGPTPGAREGHTAVYDAVRDRMIVFAGSNGNWRSDLWELSLGGTPAWHELVPPLPRPSARGSATAIVDGSATRMIVYG